MEGLVLRAALLSRYGASARGLARRFAAITAPGDGRSCLEAGAPMQLTIDAPGPPGLRIGVRIGSSLHEALDSADEDAARAPLEGLVSPGARGHLLRMLRALPPALHPSLGTWLFWTEQRQSIFVDLRDPEPRDALTRLHAVLDSRARERLETMAPDPGLARPWALRVEADDEGLRRVHVHWLIARHVEARAIAESLVPGAWSAARRVLGHLLRAPGRSGRFVVATPLDEHSEPALRIACTGWTLVPEDAAKHRAVGAAMAELGGPRDHAQALWSLCRGAAGPRWRVGRACEVRVSDEGPRLRLFLTPQVETVASEMR